MYTYKLLNSAIIGAISNTVLRSDGVHIPMDKENSDYQAYLAWVAEGGQVLPADE